MFQITITYMFHISGWVLCLFGIPIAVAEALEQTPQRSDTLTDTSPLGTTHDVLWIFETGLYCIMRFW